MPLYDLVNKKVITGPAARFGEKNMTCQCGHAPNWHNRMDRACGHTKCDCRGFMRGRSNY